jgi:hypothetical protein
MPPMQRDADHRRRWGHLERAAVTDKRNLPDALQTGDSYSEFQSWRTRGAQR